VPDQTVKVTFDPNADPQFTFDPPPGDVRMTAAGKIILNRSPGSAAWKFTDGDVKKDPLAEFEPTVHGNGSSLHINDQFKDTTRTEYDYYVTVELNGTSYTSPDPKIVNDPGTGGVGS
jgi:hypothetical protein